MHTGRVLESQYSVHSVAAVGHDYPDVAEGAREPTDRHLRLLQLPQARRLPVTAMEIYGFAATSSRRLAKIAIEFKTEVSM